MMLYGKNNQPDAGLPHGFTPLVCIQLAQIEYPGVFHAVAPLFPGEGVGTEVYKRYELIAQGIHLIGRRHNVSRLGKYAQRVITLLYTDGIAIRPAFPRPRGASLPQQGYRQSYIIINDVFHVVCFNKETEFSLKSSS